MSDCLQELCWNWNGDGRHCICERLGIEPDTTDDKCSCSPVFDPTCPVHGGNEVYA